MTTQEPNKKAITALSTGHFVTDMFASALVPLYPFIASKLNITLAIISLVLSIGHLSSSLMQPLFGFIADQTKHRTFMLWGLVLGSCFIPLTVCMPQVWLFGLCLILGMCGNSLFHPQATTMINVFTYKDPGITKYMGLFLGLGTIGYAVSPVISSYMVESFGIFALFYITLLGVLAAVMMYFFVPKIPFKAARRSKEKFFEIIAKIFRSRELVSLILISIMKSVVTLSFATYMPFLLKSYGYNLGQIGLIMTCFYTLAGIATVTSSKTEQLLGAQNVVRLSFLAILPMTLAFLYCLKAFPTLAIIIFIAEGFFAFLSVSVTMCIAQKLMSEHKGVISGAMGGFSWSMAALSLAPLGFMAEHVGIDKILILIGVLALFVGIFGVDKKLRDLFSEPCEIEV